MSNEIVTLLRKRREELNSIVAARSNWSSVTEWHTRTRPLISQHFSSELDAFDRILAVRWVAFPRVVGPGIDNSRTDAAERSGNEAVVKNAHAKFLAHLDALIELHPVDDGSESETQESDAIFAEIDSLLDNSLLPQQYKSIIAGDVVEAQLAYRSGAFKACVVMLGAALEGMMLGTLVRTDVLISLANSTNPPGSVRRIGNRDPLLADKIGGDLSFEDYKVCIHELVSGSDDLGVDNIQSFRNAIHPWKSIQEPLKYNAFDRARALHYVGSLKKILEALSQWTP